MRSFGSKTTVERIFHALVELDTKMCEVVQPSELIKFLPKEGDAQILRNAKDLSQAERLILKLCDVRDIKSQLRGIQLMLCYKERGSDTIRLCNQVRECINLLFENQAMGDVFCVMAEIIAVNDCSCVEPSDLLDLSKVNSL
jgi:hypothetical protein